MTFRLQPLSQSFVRFSLGRVTSCAVVAAFLTLSASARALAQQGSITGRVIDAELAEALPGVLVELLEPGGRVIRSLTTEADGQFRFTAIAPARYSLVFSTIGYETRRLDGVNVRAEPLALGDVTLVSRAFRLNPVVVTASRREEKALDAPASVYTVETREIEERPATTTVDYVRGIPGVDVVSNGLAQHNTVARGFNNIFSGALYVLTDNRWASVPSLRFNAYNLIPTVNDDIERIEFVLGPGSALYGPNVDKGVMHILTRSPLRDQQTFVSVMGGEREIFQGSLRHAGLASENVGYKITGQYFRGREWRFLDPVELENAEAAQPCLADYTVTNPACQPFLIAVDELPPREELERIAVRDFDAENFSGEARLDFKLADETGLILSGGFKQIGSSIELTGIGAAQAKDWRYTYVQARFRHKRLFAQSYINFSDAGDTYILRTGAPITDNSLLYVGQVQHGVDVGERERLTYGVDVIRTIPKTEGTINGRNEDSDDITEVGGYVQSETRLSPAVDFVAALRLDYHDVVDEVVASPRAAFVFKPAEGHNFRVTYNRAFSQPTTVNLFLDILSSPTLGGLPFAIVASGAKDGFRFSRECGGLCMHSPFTPPALGGPPQPLPLDVTPFWPAAVQILAAQAARDPRLANVPPQVVQGLVQFLLANQPNATQVQSIMRRLDRFTGTFVEVQDVPDLKPIDPTITNTIEVGYKGIAAERFLLGVDVYYSIVEDFIGPLDIETPNVFLEPASLTAFLGPRLGAALGPLAPLLAQLGLTAEQVAQIIIEGLARVPLGSVTPDNTTGGPADLLLTYKNFEDNLDLWGIDLGATFLATDWLSLTGSYSFASKNFFEDEDVALNAPKHKASLGAEYRNERRGLTVELRGRFVDAFPVQTGEFAGRVPSYVVFDGNLTYRPAFARSTDITVTGLNILDNDHREMVGAPEIGRLLLVRLRQRI